MFLLFLLFVVSQVGLLVFSPKFKDLILFRWYYQHIYYPLFTDYTRYRWKYWLVPGFYACILIFCVHLFYNKLNDTVNPYLYSLEKAFIPITIAFTSLTGVASVFVKPLGLQAGPQFQPDYIIFHPSAVCQTCKTIKVPRSKHCPICERCIPLHDHHCIWINNCVGYGNYEYFYSFLLSNCLLLTYASLRLLTLFRITAFKKDKFFLSLFLLTTAFSLIAIVFTYYQLKLVNDGMTNNEQDKWYLVQEYMRNGNLVKDMDGVLYYRSMSTDAQTAEPIFYSTNLYDHSKYHLINPAKILSHEEIINLYDRGSFLDNLKERIHLLD
ncbi:palmitoyltransferase SWF1 [Kluyveromyces lactis]|uniref:Palmitoyltransferase SWF1 n=1 Tax=Kluyveromyces lactis (strain ATCC 8585 / CBS 2359 / DSM 70799 / NBRC 1267 / NRRL Y-1140 / WM37) TaxID=284590 RepID=SWF1_KLULA|nr:uncharacterized protein KLLA0_F19690g [Kluyveromyces lactis]Q6CJC5.1 RecName: Full=Palmitoyltransferase SWF1 [Kluyveromyces lactis NRRL Y-1140]CAG98672.1 KLLA0F19690p [Kluyveromyces lactis]|eukprot:XP_455964.1 uncharacterized protein KLLA0_F19690g [Kluyveromyces lactis]